MLASAVPSATIYVACLRNLAATAEEVSRRHFQVAILAAGEGETAPDPRTVTSPEGKAP